MPKWGSSSSSSKKTSGSGTTSGSMSCVPFRSCNQHVEFVDKRHQSLATIPDDTFRYSRTLEELLLDANHIRELPKQLTNLTRLRKLCLSDNEIRELPATLGNLSNLAELDVSRNEIHSIPPSVRTLGRLRHLDLSSNPITSLPPAFCELKSLTILTLNDTALQELPDGFGALTSLVSIELRENALRSLPSSFENLKNLERLDLGDNELTDLPSFIGGLIKLTELWLDHNLLFRLPREIGNLINLLCLDVSENQIDELPEEIGNLRNLSDFLASQNNLDRIPTSIGQLSNLSVLKLEGNKLSKIHPNLRQCMGIQELFLKENLLDELGDWIGGLKNLKILNLDCNRISSVTERIENCKEMGVLSLRMNQIERLPDEIGACSKLMVLDLSGNRLQNLPFTISSLPLLKAVWLSENQSTPMPHFSTDYVLGEPVLTCYLLPQFSGATGDSTGPGAGGIGHQSLQSLGSMNGSLTSGGSLYRVSGDLDLSSASVGFPNSSAATGPMTSFLLPQSDDHTNTKDQTQQHMETSRVSTVKFQDGSDDDESMNGKESESTTFVRHNTPHPKDLKAKFQKWFGGGSSSSSKPSKSKKSSAPSPQPSPLPPDENENSTFRPERQNFPIQTKEIVRELEETFEKRLGQNGEEILEETITRMESTSEEQVIYEEKHVDFVVEGAGEKSGEEEEEEEQHPEEKQNLRLHRRDTPHHLKNKRILSNTDSTDSDAIKAILERAKQQQIQTTTPVPEAPPATTTTEEKLETLELILQRKEGAAFGLNIAGGLGSSPFVANDHSIFISKVVPGGLAVASGLRAGDRVLSVNGVDFTNIEHMGAVDAIKKAGDKIIFRVERKVIQTAPAPAPAHPEGIHIPINFDALIPSEVKSPSAVVTVTVKHPDSRHPALPVPDLFPENPTDLGTTTEVITKSTLTETVFTRVTHNEPVLVPLTTEDIEITKNAPDESIGIRIITTTSDEEDGNEPFGPATGPAGVYVVHVTKDGPAHRAGLRTGHRIIEINGKLIDPTTDKNRIALMLLETRDRPINLRIRKHPPPPGFMEIRLLRSDGEPLGMHIKGGTDNPGNPLDKNDSGIFISKIIPTGAIAKNNLIKVGMRILCVNGNPLLNVTHNEAVGVLRGAGNDIELLLCSGYDPEEVERLRAEGRLPDKIVEVLSNSEEAAAAAAMAAQQAIVPSHYKTDQVDRVMEVVKAAENLVGLPPSTSPIPPTPTDSQSHVHFRQNSSPCPPKSPLTGATPHDVKKTTIVMTGHSLTSPSLGGTKKLPILNQHQNQQQPTYANLYDLEAEGLDPEYTNGVGIEVRNPIFQNGNGTDGRPPLPPNPPRPLKSPGVTVPPPVPTPRTSINSISSGTGGLSPLSVNPPMSMSSTGQQTKEELIVRIKDLSPREIIASYPPPPPPVAAPAAESSPESNTSSTPSSPVFQFSPEFHRVPSPIIRKPEHTYIPELPIPTIGQVETVTTVATPAASVPLESIKTPPISSPVSTSTVSARAKFFEMEIQHLQQPGTTNKQTPTKQPFSFLSQDEIDKMKQEEERKIAEFHLLSAPPTVPPMGELSQVEEEDEEDEEEETEETEETEESDRDLQHQQMVKCTATTIKQKQNHEPQDVNVNVCVNVQTPKRAFLNQQRPSPNAIRTAKAEKRFKERLSKEGMRQNEEPQLDLSPSEQRALQAEKRAAWRQARLKSLEQDAVQAQMVLNRMGMSGIFESPPQRSTATTPTPPITTTSSTKDQEKDDEEQLVGSSIIPDAENNLPPVETTEQKIISIELQSPNDLSTTDPDASDGGPISPTGTGPGAMGSSIPLANNTNSSRKRNRRKNSKKK